MSTVHRGGSLSVATHCPTFSSQREHEEGGRPDSKAITLSDLLPEDNAAGVLVLDINSDNEAQRLHEPEAITESLQIEWQASGGAT